MDGIVFNPKPQISSSNEPQFGSLGVMPSVSHEPMKPIFSPLANNVPIKDDVVEEKDEFDEELDRIAPLASPAFSPGATFSPPHSVSPQQFFQPATPSVPVEPEVLSASPVRTPSMSDGPVSYADAKIQEIDITKIIPNPYQPRKIFDEKALQELAESIREHGVIQPLVVTETVNGYELVVGERRFRASQLAGISKIPAIVKKEMQDQTKLEVALIENIQRQELNPIEEAQAYERLMKTFNLTQEQVAKKVGKSRPAVANTVRLLNLPAEIQRGVIEGRISEGHGRALLGLPDMERQIQMFKLILEQGLNVRQVEQKVREVSLRRQLDSVNMDPKFVALESELRQKLSAQVKIQRSGKGGRIMIEFFSEDELKEILERMTKIKDTDPTNPYITV